MNLKKMASLMMPITALLTLISTPAAYGADFSLSSSSGIWTGTNGGSNIDGIGTNEVSWGVPFSSDGQSGLRFDGIGSLEFDIDQTINIGSLTHFNNPIFNPASGATLELSLELSTPSLTDSFTFAFDIDETTNTEPCTYPSDTPCSDQISFPASFPTESFSFNGSNYTVELLGFGSSASNIESGFISQEGGSNATDLFARITQPENQEKTPESMTLGGLGLVGFYVIRRRLHK